MLKKMIEEFKLHEKLCFIDKTPFTEKDLSFIDPPNIYNGKIRKAMEALDEQLSTFAVMDKGIKEDEKLYLLVERGNFWGMGYVSSLQQITSATELKNFLQPYADNDTIRNSIYSFVEMNPEKKMVLVL